MYARLRAQMGVKMTQQEIMDQIHGKLIVSCQALKEEPLYSSYIMSRMAYAAMEGGAAGIRANTVEDITAIKKIYITPTMKEVDALASCGCEIIAADATMRLRPDGKTLDEFFNEVRKKYPAQLFMADCSTIEEGMHAAQLGFDFIGTTLSGYTSYTKGSRLPDYSMMKTLAEECGRPVIAEGGIWCPEDLGRALDTGVFAAVVGTAVTRPREITRRFVQAIAMREAK